MKFSKTIKNLEKKGIISRKPNPILPFLLAFISLIFGVLAGGVFGSVFFLLAGFTFIFAILHLIVVKILKN